MGKIPKWKRIIDDMWFSFRLKMMNSLLSEYGMDWGNYPIEEIYKLYVENEDKINRK